MKHPLIITSSGGIWNGQRSRVLPSLPYHSIARRAYASRITYDTEIDVSAVMIYTLV